MGMSQKNGLAKKRRRLQVELLEQRLLLSHVVEPFITVVTHGFQADGYQPAWVTDLAEEISNRFVIDASRHKVATFHWIGSNLLSCPGQISRSGGQQLGKSLAKEINELFDAINQRVDVHLIGHSRGSSVISEAAKYLASSGIESRIGELQLTTLDPHPVDLRVSFCSDPEITMASIVDRWDNYFQTSD